MSSLSKIIVDKNIEFLLQTRREQGDWVASIFARALIDAGCHMLKLIYGPRLAAEELYAKADLYSCEPLPPKKSRNK